jgi:hypothetical protein
MNSNRLFLFIPGTLFWAFAFMGMATKKDVYFGIAIGLLVISFAVVGIQSAKKSSALRKERHRIWTEGLEAKATIVKISTKGGGLNDNPNIDFELEVHDPSGERYPVETQALVSKLAIPRIQPQCEIVVHVDKQDKTKLVIDETLTPYGYKALPS